MVLPSAYTEDKTNLFYSIEFYLVTNDLGSPTSDGTTIMNVP
jgi:hypothetical protein